MPTPAIEADSLELAFYKLYGCIMAAFSLGRKYGQFSELRTFELGLVSLRSRDKTYYLCSKIFRYFQYFIHKVQNLET